jgi:hypothetical protein
MRMLSRLVLLSVSIGVVVATGFAVVRWLVTDDAGWSLVENRAWIERMPRTPRDMTRKIAFIHDDGERVGVVVHSSEFRLFRDVFFWFRRDDGRVRMTFPQVQKDRMPAIRGWRCEGEAPAPFELCMEIKDGDQRLVLYSMNEWELGGAADLLAPGAPWSQLGAQGEAGAVEDVDGANVDAADERLDAGDDTDDAFPGF